MQINLMQLCAWDAGFEEEIYLMASYFSGATQRRALTAFIAALALLAI